MTGCNVSQKSATIPENKATVYTTFTVDTLGNVTNVKVIQVDCFACPDSSIRAMMKEAVSAVEAQPKWKIARDKFGNKTSIKFNLPVVFDKTKY